MMVKKINIAFLLLNVLLAGVLVFLFISSRSNEQFRCIAINEVNVSGKKMNGVVQFNFGEKMGSFAQDGIISANQETTAFKLKTVFDYVRDDDAFYMTSRSVSIQPPNMLDSPDMDDLLSDFFYKEKIEAVYYFRKINKKALVVYSGSFPIMYCML